MQSRLAGPILILLSALCFSVTGTLQALAPAGATPWVIAEVRMVTSAFFLFLWCAATGKLPKLTADLPWRAIIICACCTCLYQLFFFFGALKLGVAVGTVVCVGATPIMSAIVAKFVLGHSPRPIWYVATLIAVVGIGLLNIKSFEAGNLGWVIVPLLGAMVYGIYMNASPEVSSHMQPEAGIMIGLCMISVMLAPVLVLFPIDWIWSSPRGLLVSAAFGMKTTAPVVSATLSLAEPMGAACLGIFLLGEDSSLPTIAGIALIIGAILILILDGARVEKEAKKAAG